MNRISPLGHRSPQGEANNLCIKERSFIGKHILRIDNEETGSRLLERGFDIGLAKVGMAEVSDLLSCFWLSPNEWFLVSAEQHAAAVADRLQALCIDTDCQLVNIEDQYTIINLEGFASTSVLGKLIQIDLHPEVFIEGSVARTLCMGVSVILHRKEDIDNNPVFDLFVGWSYADYIWCHITHAGQDAGLQVEYQNNDEKCTL